MKKYIPIIIIILLAFPVAAQGPIHGGVKPTRTPSPPQNNNTINSLSSSGDLITGLEAWWSLDEMSGTRFDSHINGLHLSDVNTVQSVNGLVDWSARFYRTNQETLQIGDTSNLSAGATDFTIMSWVYMSDKDTDKYFVSKQNIFALDEYSLWYDMSSDRFVFSVFKFFSRTDIYDITVTPLKNTWYLLIAKHSETDGDISLKVNNGPFNRLAYTNSVNDTGQPFSLGSMGNQFCDCRMDETIFIRRSTSVFDDALFYNDGLGIDYVTALGIAPTPSPPPAQPLPRIYHLRLLVSLVGERPFYSIVLPLETFL